MNLNQKPFWQKVNQAKFFLIFFNISSQIITTIKLLASKINQSFNLFFNLFWTLKNLRTTWIQVTTNSPKPGSSISISNQYTRKLLIFKNNHIKFSRFNFSSLNYKWTEIKIIKKIKWNKINLQLFTVTTRFVTGKCTRKVVLHSFSNKGTDRS